MKTTKGAFTLKTKYANNYCYLGIARYQQNNNLCLIAYDDMTEEEVMRLTVNPSVKLNDDCICIKTYSENEGLAECLIKQGLIDQTPIHAFESGFVLLPVYRLTAKGKALITNVTERRGEAA